MTFSLSREQEAGRGLVPRETQMRHGDIERTSGAFPLVWSDEPLVVSLTESTRLLGSPVR